jgi:hypothetical protein
MYSPGLVDGADDCCTRLNGLRTDAMVSCVRRGASAANYSQHAAAFISSLPRGQCLGTGVLPHGAGTKRLDVICAICTRGPKEATGDCNMRGAPVRRRAGCAGWWPAAWGPACRTAPPAPAAAPATSRSPPPNPARQSAGRQENWGRLSIKLNSRC